MGQPTSIAEGIERLRRLIRKHRCPVVIDNKSPVAFLLSEFYRARVNAHGLSWALVKDSAVVFHQRVREGRIVHLGQTALDESVLGAAKRLPDPDGKFAWARQLDGLSVPITAASLATLGVLRWPPRKKVGVAVSAA